MFQEPQQQEKVQHKHRDGEKHKGKENVYVRDHTIVNQATQGRTDGPQLGFDIFSFQHVQTYCYQRR